MTTGRRFVPPSGLVPEQQWSLAPSLYRELRRIAARKMRFERANHTLQPTALVNEAYLQLAGAPDSLWQDRAHFLALAAREMRHILVDHARAHGAHKRGNRAVQVTLDDNLEAATGSVADVLAVDEALRRLALLDARHGNNGERKKCCEIRDCRIGRDRSSNAVR